MQPLLIEVLMPLLVLLGCLALGMPVGFSIAAATIGGFAAAVDWNAALNFMRIIPYRSAAHFTFVAIPLFILMGNLVLESGVSRSLFDAMHKWLGRLPGGLAISTVLASALFGAISGSSTANVAAIGPIAVQEMRRFGYDTRLAVASVTASGVLDIMIPPSLSMIVYGLITGISVGKLFVAGVVPGLLSVLVYAVAILIMVKRRPSIAPPAPATTWPEKVASLSGVGSTLAMIAIVLGGLYGGVFTPTEAAAIGVVLAALIALRRSGRSAVRGLKRAALDAVSATGTIFFLIMMATALSYFLSATRVPQHLMEWVVASALPPWLVLGSVIVLFIILGCFLDAISIMVITLPVAYPVISALGYDGLWFGVITTKCMEIGLLTPPLGLNVYVMHGVTKIPVEEIFRSVVPFIIAEYVSLAILLLFPDLALFLPSKMW